MKKLALTSLLAVFAVSTAHAANVINGDPMYRPAEGHFYSVTTLGSDTDHTATWGIDEEFGYGITDRLFVSVSTSASEGDWFDSNENSWDHLGVNANWRALKLGNFAADVFGGYAAYDLRLPHGVAFDKDETFYMWTAGVRVGYITSEWTLAGHVAFDYGNTESFNWNKRLDDNNHQLRVGIDSLWQVNPEWAFIVGAEYEGMLDKDAKNEGVWTAKMGSALNLDETKYVAFYVTKEMAHDGVNEEGKATWDIREGFGFQLQFGIDF